MKARTSRVALVFQMTVNGKGNDHWSVKMSLKKDRIVKHPFSSHIISAYLTYWEKVKLIKIAELNHSAPLFHCRKEILLNADSKLVDPISLFQY